MKILCLGDVVGNETVDKLKSKLQSIIAEMKIDFTVINGENANMGHGNGITPEQASALFMSGADVLTGGNHSFANYRIYQYMNDNDNILRPANCPGDCPGGGSTIVTLARRILVINVSGRVMMNDMPYTCPFNAIEKILAENEGKYDISILDIHAETTSEKYTIASHFDGKINIIFGTHTHVPTADERILPKGSGYITDLGMCGPENSSLGLRPDIAERKMRIGMPVKFELSDNPIVFEGAVFTLENDKVVSVERVRIK